MRPLALLLLLSGAPAVAQVDQARAAAWFREIAAACEREGGRLWGVSLCGPLAVVDAPTKTIATNQPAPAAPQPPYMGFANTALEWGGVRWSTVVYRMVPDDAPARARLFLHELYHRIQPQLGYQLRDGQNEHLDTPEGRYWIQLEWRALAKALASAGDDRTAALRDALAFRAARQKAFPAAAENERLLEINEGLAQYTGTVAAAGASAAIADTIRQLEEAPRNQSFVRTFAYPSGAAYGLMLDQWSPGWTRRLKFTEDLAQLLATTAKLEPSGDVATVANRYGGAALRAAEETREQERQARVAALRRQFVEGPVVTLPAPKSFAFTTAGITPIPGYGTIYPGFRATAAWGTIDAARVLISEDRSQIMLPAPFQTEGATLTGDGWKVTLAADWVVKAGTRSGDFVVAPAP